MRSEDKAVNGLPELGSRETWPNGPRRSAEAAEGALHMLNLKPGVRRGESGHFDIRNHRSCVLGIIGTIQTGIIGPGVAHTEEAQRYRGYVKCS